MGGMTEELPVEEVPSLSDELVFKAAALSMSMYKRQQDLDMGDDILEEFRVSAQKWHQEALARLSE